MAHITGGLDKMLRAIEDESSAKISELREKAKNEADAIEEKARSEADSILTEAKARADKIFAAELDRLKRSDEHASAQEKLSNRQKRLDALISDALGEIKSNKGKSYFALLTGLLQKYGEDKDGSILMNEDDIKGGAGAFELFKKTAESNFPKLSITASPRVDSGFIISDSDSGIEENCTIDALAEANADSIKMHLIKELGI